MDHDTQVITSVYEWSIFERYHYFLQYFNYSSFGNDPAKDRDRIINYCKNFIPDILFDILWRMDDDFNHTANDSYIKQALTSLTK